MFVEERNKNGPISGSQKSSLTLSMSAKQSSAHLRPKCTVARLLYASAKKGSILITSDSAARASVYCFSATYCFVLSISSCTSVCECLVQQRKINCSAGLLSSSVSTMGTDPVRNIGECDVMQQ
jgi:hypothetical protein